MSTDESREEGDLACDLLTDWWLGNVRRMVEEVGSERTIELLWPHHRNASLAAFQFLQAAMGLEPEEGWDWTHCFGWISQIEMHILNRRPVMQVAYMEAGNLSWMDDCLLRDGPSEVCEVMCRRGTRFVCDTLSQDATIDLISTLPMGDRKCAWLTYRRSRPRPDPERMGKELALGRSQTFAREFIDALCLQYLSECWVMSTRAIASIDGGATCEKIIYPLMKTRGANRAAAQSLPGSDPEGVALEIVKLQSSLAMLGHREIKRDGRIRGVVSECPFKDAPPETCGQFEAFCGGICEAADPRMHFSYLSSMAKGDKECVWEIRMDSPLPIRGASDPLQVLKLRFARGEISEEQYLRMRSLLES
jgi:hypothetical protein